MNFYRKIFDAESRYQQNQKISTISALKRLRIAGSGALPSPLGSEALPSPLECSRESKNIIQPENAIQHTTEYQSTLRLALCSTNWSCTRVRQQTDHPHIEFHPRSIHSIHESFLLPPFFLFPFSGGSETKKRNLLFTENHECIKSCGFVFSPEATHGASGWKKSVK